MFVLDNREFDLGQTIPVRVRVLNEQFQPLTSPTFPVDVYDANGRPLTPSLILNQDRFRPAEYTGEFRADLAGRYRLEMEVPGMKDRLKEELQIRLPEREFAEMTQNVAVLTALGEPRRRAIPGLLKPQVRRFRSCCPTRESGSSSTSESTRSGTRAGSWGC